MNLFLVYALQLFYSIVIPFIVLATIVVGINIGIDIFRGKKG